MIRFWPVLLFCGACASPLGGEDLTLGAGASGFPGPGVVVSASQRLHSVERHRVDLELDWTHQELDDDPEGTDEDWEQVRLGFFYQRDPAADRHWTARAGVVWLRAQGDPVALDAPGDYGGVYFGLGYLWKLSDNLSHGPDVALLLVDGEGSESGGLVPQAAWRLVWDL